MSFVLFHQSSLVNRVGFAMSIHTHPSYGRIERQFTVPNASRMERHSTSTSMRVAICFNVFIGHVNIGS